MNNLNKTGGHHSNSDKDDIFDRKYKIMRKKGGAVIIRIALAKELWHNTLSGRSSERRLYKFFSIDVEQDMQDPTLKIYNFILLGFMINVGIV